MGTPNGRKVGIMGKKKEKEEQPVENPNMKLWDQVCETDPSITKAVTQRGGFTAVCAQSQRKRATELWGSYGNMWGLRDLKWEYLLVDGKPVELILTAVFHYPDGAFEVASEIVYRAGGDCHKKLQTDVITKSLSMLGFNSDIFEGKFDDDKYVAEMYAKFQSPAKEMLDKDRKMTSEDKRRMNDLKDKLEILGDEAGLKVSKKKLVDRVISLGGYPVDDKEVDKMVNMLKNEDIYNG
jgi:hypothetical protein